MSQLSQLRDINANAKVVVVKGATAQNVLQLSSPVEPRAAVYLVDLLERNHFTGMINQATVSEYWRKHYTLGIDPVVALIDITGHEDEKEGFRGWSRALNSAGKMTGTLTDEEVISYNIGRRAPGGVS